MTLSTRTVPTRLLAVGMVASLAVAGAGFAAPQDDFTFEPPPLPAVDADFDEAARTPEAVARAEALLRDVAKAYRTAPTMADVVRIDVVTPFGNQSDSMDLVFGSGTDALLRVTGITITSVNGELFVEIPEFSEDKFVAVPIKDRDMLGALNSIGDGFSLPLPHLTMRFGDEDASMSQLLGGLGAGALEDLKVAGHRKGDGAADGQDEVLIGASNGVAVAHVNGTTRLIERVRINFSPADAPPGMSLMLDLAFTPRVSDELSEPIAFAAGDRKRVSTIEALMQKLEIGAPAPAFSLKTLDGTTVTLEDLRGHVVVIDFWATWCGPCRRGLPLLDEFAKWAAAEEKKVKVFGINVWEDEEKDRNVRTEKASAYWNEAKFSFPTLMDFDDAVADAFGPNGIPTTFIIDPQGRIAAIHNGFSPDMVDRLKADVAAAKASTARPE